MSRLVLLSGWGVDARLWRTLAPHWPTDVTLETPDWPGYGARPALASPGALDALAAAMAGSLPSDAVWVGWSLGGLLAAALLERLPAPRALVLLGMNARFTDTHGIGAAELASFRRAFSRAPTRTWRHFLRCQLAGEPDPRHAYQRLDALLGLDAMPADAATLATGLEQLATWDVRHRLAAPPCPILRLRGRDDPLLPPPDGSEWSVIPDAGHCPQLSAPQALVQHLSGLAQSLHQQAPGTLGGPDYGG